MKLIIHFYFNQIAPPCHCGKIGCNGYVGEKIKKEENSDEVRKKIMLECDHNF